MKFLNSPRSEVHEVQELFQEIVHEVQMVGSRTSVLEFQELVHEVQMVGSRTSVLENN